MTEIYIEVDKNPNKFVSNPFEYLLDSSEPPVVFGYFGKNNFGDDLMFMITVNKIPSVQIIKGRKMRTSDIELSLPRYVWNILINPSLVVTGGNIFSKRRFRSIFKIVGLCLLINYRSICGFKTIISNIGLDRPIILKKGVVSSLNRASYVYVRSQEEDGLLSTIDRGHDIVSYLRYPDSRAIKKVYDLYLPSFDARAPDSEIIVAPDVFERQDEDYRLLIICQSKNEYRYFKTRENFQADVILYSNCELDRIMDLFQKG